MPTESIVSNVTIREPKPSDVASLLRLVNSEISELHIEFPPAEPQAILQMIKRCQSPECFGRVAELENEQVIGVVFAYLQPIPTTPSVMVCNVATVFVAKGYRNREAGNLLLQSVEAWASLMGATKLIVGYLLSKPQAKKFFESHQFRETEVIMEKEI